MASPSLSPDDQRIIIHLDYDCFYASVFEVEHPAWKTRPLAVQQKQIVVTCNYEARRRGLRKLQLIREAKQICPELLVVLGEDLSRFRDASKELYHFLRPVVWGGRIEKLGLDELFLDVSHMVDYNVDQLNPHDLDHSFFHLDRHDPTRGFVFNATTVHGPTYPADGGQSVRSDSRLDIRLRLASHLAAYLRSQLETQKGYTATAGIATSKLLAKLVGSTHKPNSQTTLLPPYGPSAPDAQGNVRDFLDRHQIRQIPGIGTALARKITAHLTVAEPDGPVTVQDLRRCPGMGPARLDRILSGPGAPKEIGWRVWRLIHGVDTAEVLPARDLPTQISIEDTYGRIDTIEQVRKALIALTISLIRRMRTDLTEPATDVPHGLRWLARPRTLRLSTRLRPPVQADGTRGPGGNRVSRSAPLPPFVLHLDERIDAVAERLVQERTLPLFRRLHPEPSGWNLHLMNVAVTNLVETAGSGQDIGRMFQRPEMSHPRSPPVGVERDLAGAQGSAVEETPLSPTSDEDGWEDSDEDRILSVPCATCGVSIPHFALVAHQVYHSVAES
ncbi:DNA/RNA polymerase [Aspergillus taichungensis]|uniref:DNA/RNA polymerase n=1 Tax=Aspergillus taichungensis TaxID=482145 RepID=A0A2J5I5I4_9EURO|nr:DNA/RNA polymerase [Aspergillus taichungensis]